MTRTDSRKAPGSERPEPLGRVLSAPGVARPAGYRPSLKQATPYPLDAYPFGATPRERDRLRQEEQARALELADLPDTWTEEELVEAEAAWRQWNETL